MKQIIIGIIVGVLMFSGIENDKVLANIDEKKQMIIVFDEELSKGEIDKTITDVGGEVTETYDEVGVAKVELASESIDELLNDTSVKYVEEDIILKQSAQIEDYGIQTTKIPNAWNSGYTGRGVKIAVVDSGIALHNDLFISGGVSTVDYTSSYIDDQGHGTHVAGIIGARNNSYGVKGVAYESDIYAVKAFNQDGEAFLSDIIEGIDWAIENDMDIINLSAGTQTASSAFHAVMDKAYNSGLLIVAAAGNDGNIDGSGDTVDFPARYDSVIGVSAVDSYLNRANFSSTGSMVEIAAPGVRILSTYLGNQYAYISGTSMAAPYVSGELALMIQAYPHLSNKEIRKVMIEHTMDLGQSGRDAFYGYGLMQASSFTQPINIIEENPVTSLIVSKTNIFGMPSDNVSISAFATYKIGETKDVSSSATWTTADSSIATVTGGQIVMWNYGSTTVSVKFGGQTATIFVKVISEENPVIRLETDKSNILGTPGDFMDVTATATFKSGERKVVTDEVQWTSENESVATVSNGRIEFVNYGITTINVTYKEQTSAIMVNIPNPQTKPIGGNFKDITSFYAPAVDYLIRQQITSGLSETEFGVKRNIIRADAAIWLAKELKLNIADAPASGFVDVPKRAIGAVNALKQAGIIGGKSKTLFGANDNLSRGEVAIILQRAYDLTTTGTSSKFTDVSARYKDAVNALVDNDVTDGISSTKFGVTSNITRGQLAVFMYRLSEK